MIRNVLEYLERSSEQWGFKTAIEDADYSINYRDLVQKAKTVGSYLSEVLKGKTNRPVGVYIERNVESVIAFLGIVYSGNFYVPVDPALPIERIKRIVDKLRPEIILNASNRTIPGEAVSLKSILSDTGLQVDERTLRAIRQAAIDTDPLYAIFTSGSSGAPKGVLVSHRSVIDLAEAFAEAFHLSPANHFGNQAPFDFDVSTKDIYCSLLCGGTVSIIPRKLFKTPKLLVDYLTDRKINTLIWAVSALRILCEFDALADAVLPSLKAVMFSGEVMPPKTLNYWRHYFPEALFVNLYGPTEITCNCTYYIVNRDYALNERIPVGNSFSNSRVFLLDEGGRPVTQQGIIGEICVSGSSLALGYWDETEMTDRSFCQNPLIKEYPSRIYKTGDLGKYNAAEELVYVARRDQQIKHMGHRIELGEIETAVNAIPFIDTACCLFNEERERICCFYQSKCECKNEIIKEISRVLPKYMWPNSFYYYHELPMTEHGKIDRQLLKRCMLENDCKQPRDT